MPFSLDLTTFCPTGASRQCRWRALGLIAAVLITGGSTWGQIPEPTRLDADDSRFFDQLSRRRLYDLAADFAQVRIDRHQEEEAQAFWVDRLATAYRLRTWEESGPNRRALTRQAVESVTNFLKDQVVRPETDLALRLSQIESLLNLAQINLLLHDVGHRGPDSATPREAAAGVQPYLEEAAGLVDALLRQLETVRTRLDRRRSGRLRERANRLAVQLAVIRHLSARGGPTSEEFRRHQSQQLRDRLKAIERSARMSRTRQVAGLLLAELQIAENDDRALAQELRGRNSPLTEPQRRVLRVRLLLHQGKAMEALEAVKAAKLPSSDIGSELAVLRLESLMLLRMQADDLQDASLRDQSDQEFSEHRDDTIRWRPSVWKDAADRVAQRYELVRNVGGEVTVLVEHVEMHRAAGKYEEALRMLQRALRLLPPEATMQSRAAIQLRMGEILIAQREWAAAIPLFNRAEELFADSEHTAPASTAALLSVYCVGQQWKQNPADDSLRAAYFDGLVAHRTRWKDEVTQEQSTEWLVQLTEQIDPLYSAALLVDLAMSVEVPRERLKCLIKAGEQLEQTREFSARTRAQRTRGEQIEHLVDVCDQEQLTQGTLTDQSARLLLLRESLTVTSATEWKHWSDLSKRLPQARTALVDVDPGTEFRLLLLELVAVARTSTDSQVWKRRQQEFLARAASDPMSAAGRLSAFLRANGLVQPGDALVAATIEQLIASHLPAASTTTQLSELLRLATLANRVTSNGALRQQVLDHLLMLELNSAQATQVASALMQVERQPTEKAMDQLWGLWNRVQSEAEEGSELWLESCLQVAQLRAHRGQAEAAARQLQVTGVIYPEWGAPDRRQRVSEFLRKHNVSVQGE